MNMLVEILLKDLERFVQSLIADANVWWDQIIAGCLANFAQNLSGRVVFLRHHADRISNFAERSKRRAPLMNGGVFKFDYTRKQNLFFLEHMGSQIGAQARE